MSDEKLDGEETPDSTSPEYLELLKDLNQYDNPEVFRDAALPQYYFFRILNKLLPGVPDVLSIEVNGEVLPLILREAVFAICRLDPDAETTMRVLHGHKEWAETRATMVADEKYLWVEQEMCRFFVRHLPKLMLKLHDIAVLMTVLFASGLMLEEGPEEKKESEGAAKQILANELRALEKEVKRMLGTRPRGGSTAKLKAEKRKSLHAQYDNLYRTAKAIKKHYEELLKRYKEGNRRKGYTHKNWEQFWITHAVIVFPDQDRDFLALFANQDKPSASEVAYLQLSKETGHGSKYISRLVSKSRKSIKRNKANS